MIGLILVIFVPFIIWLIVSGIKDSRESKEVIDWYQSRIDRNKRVHNEVLEKGKALKGIAIGVCHAGHHENGGFYGSPNSANGYEIEIEFANCTGKVMKYCEFHTRALNRVNDLCMCSTGFPNNDLRVTGPIENYTFNGYNWPATFYTNDFDRLVIDSATITYMDGTIEEFSSDRIAMPIWD